MIPMVDLKTQYEFLKSEINEAINEVLVSTNFIQGPNVKHFEKEIANYFSIDSKNVFSVVRGSLGHVLVRFWGDVLKMFGGHVWKVFRR